MTLALVFSRELLLDLALAFLPDFYLYFLGKWPLVFDYSRVFLK